MNRAFGLAALILLGGLLTACAAGAPSAAEPPTATAQALAAVEPTTSAATATATLAPTTVAPSPTAPAPTATTPPAPTSLGLSASTVAAGEAQPTPRPAPPPDPGTGESELVPDPSTLEHPWMEQGPNPKEVALTFDAGADRGYAAEILDLLRDEGIKASFGMTGLWAEANPDLVQRMVAEGHMLFNHTWDHRSLTGASTGQPPMTAEEVAQQLGDTEAIVRELTGYELKPYFRTPLAEYDETSLRYLADNGYYVTIWWTCDTYGWKGWTANQITDYCTTNVKPHEIILLHVGAGASGDYLSLPAMIAFFRNEGYAFVTVEEMLQP